MSELFRRPNGQVLPLVEVAKCIASYIATNPTAKYEITVGTDSQTSYKTKMVEVVAVHRVGSGGIFFYRFDYVSRMSNLRQKIHEETQRSLSVADGLMLEVETALLAYNIDLNRLDIRFQIHCDVGHDGSTRALIQEIVGWVQAMGYDCMIKPNSYAASGIANRYSKNIVSGR